MNNHKQIILHHLLINGSIDAMTALNQYNIFGSFRGRISDLRKIFARYQINLKDENIKTDSGSHYFNYFLSPEDRFKLKANYSKILADLECKKEKQMSIF